MVKVYEYQTESLSYNCNFWDENTDLLNFIIRNRKTKQIKCRWHDKAIASYQNLWMQLNKFSEEKSHPQQELSILLKLLVHFEGGKLYNT